MKRFKLFAMLAAAMATIIILFNINALAEDNTMREKINFNTDWLYSPHDYSNGQLADLNEDSFEGVSIPHANKILETHKGPDFQEQIDSYRFVSWYRRHFTMPKSYDDGKRVIVEFEGVATVADVYVNGEYIGTHKGAYTGFSFDITDYIKLSGDNVIAVRVDSTKRSDIPPEGGSVDYCLFGGIVRNVNMIITGEAYIDNTFITTPTLAENNGSVATVKNQTTVVNKGSSTASYAVTTTVKDAGGNTVKTSQTPATEIAQGGSAVFEVTTEEITNPHLWSTDNPYLYTVITKVMRGDTVVDDYETKIGFRWFEFKDNSDESGDACFYLNGVKTKLVGVNRHEQWPWIGRAVNDKLQAADADLIKETGFNAVRCSHYPQSPAFLDRCDELGLIVFEEAPGWQYIGDSAWQEIYKENIREMIIRDRDHPSIVTWGTRVNESLDNDTLYNASNKLAKELDPTRPTHGVRRKESYKGERISASHLAEGEDIYCNNYVYPETPKYLPFVIGEHSWDCWTNGYGCPWATDEQALAFTKDFADKVNYYFGNDLCAGGFAWSMFDYDNEVNYTRTDNVFYSGIYDIMRLPKPAVNLYKSQKAPETDPIIYIANYWDDDAKPLTVAAVTDDIAQGGSSGSGVTTGDKFSVTVMSNCDTVELYINGVKVDKEPARQYQNLPHPFFVFDDITYTAGEITAVGYVGGAEKARYTQKTPGKVTQLTLTPGYDTITADGSDFTSVTITALDANGTYVPSADNEVTISVSGAGKFIGEQTIALEGGRSTFLVQSKYLEEGKITCAASADGVAEGTCEITVSAFNEEIVPASEGQGSTEPVETVTKQYSFADDTVCSDGKVNQGSTREWQLTSAPQYFYVDNVNFDALKSLSMRFGYRTGAAKISVYAYDNGGEKVIQEQLKAFNAAMLGEPVAKFTENAKAEWGYHTVGITSSDIDITEGGTSFEVTQKSALSVPDGTGTKAMIIAFESDDITASSFAYFDYISMTGIKQPDIELGVSAEDGVISFTAEKNMDAGTLYTALYNSSGTPVEVKKDAQKGSFAEVEDGSYTVKAFLWDGMKPLCYAKEKTVTSEKNALIKNGDFESGLTLTALDWRFKTYNIWYSDGTLKKENGNHYVSLSGTGIGQNVPIAQNKAYKLTARVRSTGTAALYIQNGDATYPGTTPDNTLASLEISGSEWHTVTLYCNSGSAEHLFAYLWSGDTGTVTDIDDVRLEEAGSYISRLTAYFDDEGKLKYEADYESPEDNCTLKVEVYDGGEKKGEGTGKTDTLLTEEEHGTYNYSLKAYLYNGDVVIAEKSGNITAAYDTYNAYMFVHFVGSEKSADEEQIYFSVSRDGKNWTTLNEKQPILKSDVGEKGVRDPYIIRGQDGKFRIIATDLSIYNRTQAVGSSSAWAQCIRADGDNPGSTGIVIWESDNLKDWSEASLVDVAPETAGCFWAPECVWDESKQSYMVFGASQLGSDNYAAMRIYKTYTTDFKTFTEPEVYIDASDRNLGVIDTTIIKAEDGKYYRFSKTDRIELETAASLDGEWTAVSNNIHQIASNVEGPSVCAVNGSDKYCVLVDGLGGSGANLKGYHPLITDSLSGGQFTLSDIIIMPTDITIRHGSILPITAAEYDSLVTNNWN